MYFHQSSPNDINQKFQAYKNGYDSEDKSLYYNIYTDCEEGPNTHIKTEIIGDSDLLLAPPANVNAISTKMDSPNNIPLRLTSCVMNF